MARRLPRLIAVVAILLLSLPAAAFAAYTARVDVPDNGVLTGAEEIRVRVLRDIGDVPVTRLRVRPASGGELQPTTCVSDCDRGAREPVFAFELDPRTGAPFVDAILANGVFEFEGIVSRELGEDRSVGKLAVTLRVPGSAVGGLAATASDDTVRLAWSRAPEPDIRGYRVERCAGTCDSAGAWVPQGDTAASASSFTDEPGLGWHSYRVVTVRESGGNGSIETVSSPVTAEVERARSSTHDQLDGDAEEGPRGGDGDGRVPDGDPAAGAQRAGDAPDLDGGDVPRAGGTSRTASSGPARTGGVRAGQAPSVALGRGGAGIPDLPGVGEIFRGELDYATDDPEAVAGRGDEVVLSAGGSFLGRVADPDRLAVPIAGGLLMTAIGLHLWRWLRLPLT